MMNLKARKIAFRDFLAYVFRSIPQFRGKQRIGVILTNLMTNYTDDAECFTTITMLDGSLIHLDLRGLENVVFFTGAWDYTVIKKLSNLLQPNSIVIDVGANIGFYSIALARKLQQELDGARLYAFEPVKPNFDRLKHQININYLEQIIFPHNLALGNTEGQIHLYMRNDNNSTAGNAFQVDENTKNLSTTYLSEITKLDVFVQKQGIDQCDLIKVDIEGGELDFFFGSVNFINKTRPVIYSEFNPYFANKHGYSFKEISELAALWSYRLYELKANNFSLLSSEPTNGDFLMIPQENESSILNTLKA